MFWQWRPCLRIVDELVVNIRAWWFRISSFYHFIGLHSFRKLWVFRGGYHPGTLGDMDFVSTSANDHFVQTQHTRWFFSCFSFLDGRVNHDNWDVEDIFVSVDASLWLQMVLLNEQFTWVVSRKYCGIKCIEFPSFNGMTLRFSFEG